GGFPSGRQAGRRRPLRPLRLPTRPAPLTVERARRPPGATTLARAGRAAAGSATAWSVTWHRTNVDLTGAVTAEAESTTAHGQEAGTSGLQDLQAATASDAQFGHAANPARFAANVADFAPFAGAEQFERNQGRGAQ